MSGADGARPDFPAKRRRVAPAGRVMANSNNGNSNSAMNSTNDIDEGLYSRQLYVLGHEAMRRMARSDVLVCGLGGLGIEIAKNVVLAGVRSVTLHDDTPVSLRDLSSQFYLSESCVGVGRAVACAERVVALNRYVEVRVAQGPLSELRLDDFRVVVMAGLPLRDQAQIAQAARERGLAVLAADTRGLFSQVFADFGEDFLVLDSNGEQPLSVMIAGVSKDAEGVVTCLDDSRHGFEDGDYVTFSEVSFRFNFWYF